MAYEKELKKAGFPDSGASGSPPGNFSIGQEDWPAAERYTEDRIRLAVEMKLAGRIEGIVIEAARQAAIDHIQRTDLVDQVVTLALQQIRKILTEEETQGLGKTDPVQP